MFNMCKKIFVILFVLCSVLGSPIIQAQNAAPIQIINPYAPGGSTDAVARPLAEKLSKVLNRSVIIDSKPGASGALATGYVVQSNPDGNTLLLQTGTISVDPVLRPNLPYDIKKDLTTVITLAQEPFAVLVNADLPIRNITELVAYAKANPGKVNYGSAGIGSTTHLWMEQFKAMAGVNITHVPYKGGSEAALGLIKNEVQILLDPIVTALGHVQTGHVRAIAVTSKDRSDMLQNVPTIMESGIPSLANFDGEVWFGIFAPSKTPSETVKIINDGIRSVLASPAMREQLNKQGFQVIADTPDQAQHRLLSEIDRWGDLIRKANIHLE